MGVAWIARSARFCKEVQIRGTALRSIDELAKDVRRPACRGCGLKNLLHRVFSFLELFAPLANPTRPVRWESGCKARSAWLCGVFWYCTESPRIFLLSVPNSHDVKNTEKGRRLGHFQTWAGKKVILVSEVWIRATALVVPGFHSLPQEVILGKS